MTPPDEFLVPGLREWTKADTIAWLNQQAVPLFADSLHWPDHEKKSRLVRPVHERLKGGYGYWLATGPQFPGLFELIHSLVLNWGGGAGEIPDGPAVLAELNRIRSEREGQGNLF